MAKKIGLYPPDAKFGSGIEYACLVLWVIDLYQNRCRIVALLVWNWVGNVLQFHVAEWFSYSLKGRLWINFPMLMVSIVIHPRWNFFLPHVIFWKGQIWWPEASRPITADPILHFTYSKIEYWVVEVKEITLCFVRKSCTLNKCWMTDPCGWDGSVVLRF